MKTVQLIPTVTAASDLNSQPYDLNDLKTFSIGVTFTGADVVGSLKLQASLDGTSYFDVANSTQAVTTSTGHIWDVVTCGYRFVRVAWDYTSGTGNITAKLFVKDPVVKFG